MRILFVSSEVVPFAKTGGLADVTGALAVALTKLGHDVRVVMPNYGHAGADGHRHQKMEIDEIEIPLGTWSAGVGFYRNELDGGIPVYLVDHPPSYHRGALYTDDSDEHARFIILQRAALSLTERLGWIPEVIHCHDWQTALIPLYLGAGDYPQLEGVPTVLTIHNLGYQGVFGSHIRDDLGLGVNSYLLHQDDLARDNINFLKHGAMYADMITTVSPTYAEEITTPQYGCGLDDLLRLRRDELVGILNGIDTDNWNPRTDPHLSYRYSAKSLWRKEKFKHDFLDSIGVRYEEGVTVVGVVSRLVWQKGIDVAVDAMGGLLEDHPELRFVALGSGDKAVEDGLRWLAWRFADQVSFTSGYDIALSHRIEAGSDLFLMPSRYEPCGLNQMYSLAYGTAPLVRRTGGLADTVTTFDQGDGNGVVFEDTDSNAVRWAVETALAIRGDKTAWKTLQINAMGADNSWANRASDYEAVYQRLAD
ncbi:MAG: glycogen synthase GlgA [Acidimicrobiia bacterium]|nr:glycogen synthase GlgA [Acidimicrobiia bacterium]